MATGAVTQTYLQNLLQIQTNIAAELANETAYSVANGPKPTYTIDGKNVLWNEWRDSKMKALTDIQLLIQQAQSPFWVTSRGRG